MKRIMFAFALCTAICSSKGIYAEDQKLTTPQKAIEFVKGTVLSGISLANAGIGIGAVYLCYLFAQEYYQKKSPFFTEDLLFFIGVPCIAGTMLWSVPKIGIEAKNSFKKAFSIADDESVF